MSRKKDASVYSYVYMVKQKSANNVQDINKKMVGEKGKKDRSSAV